VSGRTADFGPTTPLAGRTWESVPLSQAGPLLALGVERVTGVESRKRGSSSDEARASGPGSAAVSGWGGSSLADRCDGPVTVGGCELATVTPTLNNPSIPIRSRMSHSLRLG
jgi:hypothetical protein